MDQAPKFTRHVWKQLWRLIRPYFFGRTWGKAWTQLATLMTFSIASTAVSVIWAGYVMSDIMTALERATRADDGTLTALVLKPDLAVQAEGCVGSLYAGHDAADQERYAGEVRATVGGAE